MALKHQTISFIKSGLRILAGLTMWFGMPTITLVMCMVAAGFLLTMAEIVGIWEEIGHE